MGEIQFLLNSILIGLVLVFFHNTNKIDGRINNIENDVAKLGAKPLILNVSAYTADPKETDDTPTKTAYQTKVAPWTVATSRDLKSFGWVGGKYVYLRCNNENIGVFKINDLMDIVRNDGTVQTMALDVFFWEKQQAKEFGRKECLAWLLHLNN